jgi:uncharacterized protein
MNPQEYTALLDILAQLMEIRGVKKDPEADALIQAAVAQQPDATYLLAQHAMLLGVELERARARIALLVSEAQRGRSDYVDFGTAHEPFAAPSAGSSLPMAPGASTTAPTPSSLRQAGATAAGVAGGALLFRGVEEILTPHGGAFAAPTFLPATEDVTVNNYYPSEPGSEHEAGQGRHSDGDDLADANADLVSTGADASDYDCN